jgi:hypothetical protein
VIKWLTMERTRDAGRGTVLLVYVRMESWADMRRLMRISSRRTVIPMYVPDLSLTPKWKLRVEGQVLMYENWNFNLRRANLPLAKYAEEQGGYVYPPQPDLLN